MRLNDEIAPVTGASRGIGRASSRALAREGATVVVVARNGADLDAVLPHPRSHSENVSMRPTHEAT